MCEALKIFVMVWCLLFLGWSMAWMADVATELKLIREAITATK